MILVVSLKSERRAGLIGLYVPYDVEVIGASAARNP
jgi:hypothetical protein